MNQIDTFLPEYLNMVFLLILVVVASPIVIIIQLYYLAPSNDNLKSFYSILNQYN
jgi:hypothetical protein